MGLMVLCEDEAGPYQAVAQVGQAWHEQGVPARMPHEYIRAGTAKLLTLFRPATGELHAHGVTSSANAILHPWLEGALRVLLEHHPVLPVLEEATNRVAWVRWQQELTVKFTLPTVLPRLRALLVLDNLAGHKTPSLMLWLVDHGVMPVFTPLGGSWLNMRPRPSGASWGQVGRIDSADCCASGVGWIRPRVTRGSHLCVGGNGAWLESCADCVRVGWEATVAT